MDIGDDGDGDEKMNTPAADGGGSGGGGGGAGGSGTDRPTKRMMKSPYQLEVLEKTYASTLISRLSLSFLFFIFYDNLIGST